MPRRVRTHDLMQLVLGHVPASAMYKTPLALFVLYPPPSRPGLLVAVIRSDEGAQEGWSACLITPAADLEPPNRLEQRKFVTIEEAIDLFDELWPMTEESMKDILADHPAHPRAVAVASAAELFLEYFARREGEA